MCFRDSDCVRNLATEQMLGGMVNFIEEVLGITSTFIGFIFNSTFL